MKILATLGLSSLFLVSGFGQSLDPRLINGKPVEPGTFEEVVQIKALDSFCTATIVGPRTIITAAHCAPDGALAEFKVKGNTYRAKIYRSGLYKNQDHDISLGITDQEITGVKPASVGGVAKAGLGITLLGFGCTDVGGNGKIDGILRYGETVVTKFSNFDMVSQKPNGAALCFGDSGGPAFVFSRGEHLLLGVNSKGNIIDTNYSARTDLKESLDFLKTTSEANQVQVCGINKNCGSAPLPVDPPQCQVAVTPNAIQLGQSVVARLDYQGQVTAAELNGQVISKNGGEIQITPSMGGNYTVKGKVSGPGGSADCSASYSVQGPTPNVPNYTIVSTLCGDNTILETQVRQVCFGVVKYSYVLKDLNLKDVLVVIFRDGTQEVMPLLVKSQKTRDQDDRMVEQWILYANNSVTKNANLMLDTRTASVTLGSTGDFKDIPIAISGRTIKGGQAFNVEKLQKLVPLD